MWNTSLRPSPSTTRSTRTVTRDNIYCRSDHYEYARYGIPVVFITTGGHGDYHQVTDEPQYVDYDRTCGEVGAVRPQLARSGSPTSITGPVVDKPKPDPHAVCRQ